MKKILISVLIFFVFNSIRSLAQSYKIDDLDDKEKKEALQIISNWPNGPGKAAQVELADSSDYMFLNTQLSLAHPDYFPDYNNIERSSVNIPVNDIIRKIQHDTTPGQKRIVNKKFTFILDDGSIITTYASQYTIRDTPTNLFRLKNNERVCITTYISHCPGAKFDTLNQYWYLSYAENFSPEYMRKCAKDTTFDSHGGYIYAKVFVRCGIVKTEWIVPDEYKAVFVKEKDNKKAKSNDSIHVKHKRKHHKSARTYKPCSKY